MSFFKSNSYRAALTWSVEQQRANPSRNLTYQSLANEMRIQKSYLSKVIAGNAELSADQVYLAAKALRLSRIEKEFLLALHEHDRSAVAERKQELHQQIERLRAKALESQSHMDERTLPTKPEDLLEYYLEPLAQVVHMALSLTKYQNDWKQIAADLPISLEQLRELLGRLESLGIIEFKKGRYLVKALNLHLTREHAIYKPYLKALRLKSVDRMGALSGKESYGFSAIFSADEATRLAIHESFLKFLKETQARVAKAPDENVYQMNFDLFPWL